METSFILSSSESDFEGFSKEEAAAANEKCFRKTHVENIEWDVSVSDIESSSSSNGESDHEDVPETEWSVNLKNIYL